MPNYRRNKYNVSPANQRSYKGRTYDSKAEMQYAQLLDKLVEAGSIVDYCEQPKVHIAGDLWYRPDFLVVEPEVAYFVDVKGVVTDSFRKVTAAWPSRKCLPLRVIKKKGDNFVTVSEH